MGQSIEALSPACALLKAIQELSNRDELRTLRQSTIGQGGLVAITVTHAAFDSSQPMDNQ